MKALHKIWGYLEEILAGIFFVAGVVLIFFMA